MCLQTPWGLLTLSQEPLKYTSLKKKHTILWQD